jgi:CheY-like chemotaxis protein
MISKTNNQIDSARRAVEAADNVVLAYDMNMGELDSAQADEGLQGVASSAFLTPENTSQPRRGHKRGRSIDDSSDQSSKTPRLTVDRPGARYRSFSPRLGRSNEQPEAENVPSLAMTVIGQLSPGLGQTDIRSTIQSLVIDVVNGGRPESAITQPIDGGEEIEVRQLSSNGAEKVKLVRWSVDAGVPEIIDQDERELYAIISRVLQNAFKFTDAGSIKLTVELIPRGRGIVVTISDTGIGIPAAFMPRLFKAFSKEDDGIDSQREGLGLGLMVAKGMVRRLKGDLKAVRSATDGPDRGSIFEIRIPIAPGDSMSTPGSPGVPTLDATHERSFTPTHRRAFSTSPANDLAAKVHQTSHDMAQDHATAPAPPKQPPPTSCAPCALRSLAASEPPPPGTLAARLPLCILVVEDNSMLRAILVRMLHRLGYRRVLQAYDGAAAVRLMARLRRLRRRGLVDFSVDLVLMDLWMPCMNGYDAASRIWDLADGLDVAGEFEEDEDDGELARGLIAEGHGYEAEARPVILAITADVTDDALERVARAGMMGPLTKPYSRVELEKCLVNFCMPARRLPLN